MYHTTMLCPAEEWNVSNLKWRIRLADYVVSCDMTLWSRFVCYSVSLPLHSISCVFFKDNQINLINLQFVLVYIKIMYANCFLLKRNVKISIRLSDHNLNDMFVFLHFIN